MPSQIYEILSLMMRYWFAALGVLIVLRAFWWLWKDHRSREKKRRSLPDAGSIGEFVVESDCAALPQDTLLPVPADGTLGSVRSCDIVVPARGVSPRHLDVMFRNGYGLYIIPWRGCSCIVDGETVASRRDGMAHPLQHNSILEVGQARLRLRVFAGLDVEDVRAYAERREDGDDEQENPQYPDCWKSRSGQAAKKRVKGQCPLRSPEAAPLVGFGATPQLFFGCSLKENSQQRRRQRSVPASN